MPKIGKKDQQIIFLNNALLGAQEQIAALGAELQKARAELEALKASAEKQNREPA